MQIPEFIKNYKNHPVLFVGTGMSLRYLRNSYSWDELLKKIAFDLWRNDEKYLDLKSNSSTHITVLCMKPLQQNWIKNLQTL